MLLGLLSVAFSEVLVVVGAVTGALMSRDERIDEDILRRGAHGLIILLSCVVGGVVRVVLCL